MRQREAARPENVQVSTPIMLERNSGVTLVWVTRRYRTKRDSRGGLLFDIGEPESVSWWANGRPATRAKVQASIDSGLPALRELAR
jgi:hypothetical protein